MTGRLDGRTLEGIGEQTTVDMTVSHHILINGLFTSAILGLNLAATYPMYSLR